MCGVVWPDMPREVCGGYTLKSNRNPRLIEYVCVLHRWAKTMHMNDARLCDEVLVRCIGTLRNEFIEEIEAIK